jgi:dihydrolipoyl dehydrogenase
MPDYDVAVIGAGPGGYVAAIRASQLGLRTIVIEKEQVGGLCLNWGCIPSKALLHAADVLNLLRHGDDLGISYDNLRADLSVAVDRSRDIVAKFVRGVGTLLAQNGVEVVQGAARFAGPHALAIDPGDRTIDAANVIIATGARTRSLPGLAIDGDRVLTSREALALRQTPASIVIVGGGPIGVEFAYLYASYGAQVTLVEMEARLLPGEDEDVSRQLERSFAAQGIAVRTGTTVDAVTPDASGVTVNVTSAGAAEALRAERVLVGVGFAPNTEGLGLETAGVALDRGWVAIDEYARTNVPGIWAAGDVTGRLLLAHVASHQGVTAVEAIAGRNPPPLDYDQMPRAVYCQPQVAALGLTEAQARARGHDVRIGRFPFRASGKAVATGETEGFVKLVADSATNAILGVHIVGHGATEMLGEASLAMLLESTTAELAAAVHAHPTLSEAIKEAALAATGEAIHFFTPRRKTPGGTP